MNITPKFQAKLRQVGNSYAVLVPMNWVKTLDIEKDAEIELEITQVIKAKSEDSRLRITTGNPHIPTHVQSFYEGRVPAVAWE